MWIWWNSEKIQFIYEIASIFTLFSPCRKVFFAGFQGANSFRREFCRLRTFSKTLPPKRRSSRRNKRFQLNSIVNFCRRNRFSSYLGGNFLDFKLSKSSCYRKYWLIPQINWIWVAQSRIEISITSKHIFTWDFSKYLLKSQSLFYRVY